MPNRAPAQPLWVHIGGGQIGFGVVVPMLARARVRLVVITRGEIPAKPAEDDDATSAECALTVVRRDAAPRAELWTLSLAKDASAVDPALQVRRGTPTLVLVDDLKRVSHILAAATYLSTAVGGEQLRVVKDVVDQLDAPASGSRRRLYLFENSYGPFADSGKRRLVEIAHVDVVPVVVDRLSFRNKRAPQWSPSGALSLADVRVEDHLDLVARHVPPIRDADLTGWRLANTDAEFWFWYERKRFLVNAIHTAVAILGYARLAEVHYADARQAFPLVVDSAMSGWRFNRILDVFARAQSLRLVLEHGSLRVSSNTGEHPDGYLEFTQHARGALGRFRRFPDELTRVVRTQPGEISNRYATLIAPLLAFVRDPRNRDRWQRAEFARDRPPIREVEEAVHELHEMALRVESFLARAQQEKPPSR